MRLRATPIKDTAHGMPELPALPQMLAQIRTRPAPTPASTPNSTPTSAPTSASASASTSTQPVNMDPLSGSSSDSAGHVRGADKHSSSSSQAVPRSDGGGGRVRGSSDVLLRLLCRTNEQVGGVRWGGCVGGWGEAAFQWWAGSMAPSLLCRVWKWVGESAGHACTSYTTKGRGYILRPSVQCCCNYLYPPTILIQEYILTVLWNAC